MYYQVYLSFHLATIVLLFVMIIYAVKSTPSRAQLISILLFSSAILLLGGYFFEMRTDNLEVYEVTTRLEYFALSVMMILYLPLISEYCRIPVPKTVFWCQCVLSIVSFFIICTNNYHHLYSTSVESLNYGGIYVCHVYGGPYYPVCFINYFVLYFYCLVMCIVEIKNSSGVSRKRTLLLTIGMSFGAVLFPVRAYMVSRGIEVMSYFVFCGMFLIFVAFVRYGYFSSVRVAADNIVNFGKEGIVVLGEEGKVIFINKAAKEMFPELISLKKIEKSERFNEIFVNRGGDIVEGNFHYQIRVEEIIEYESVQGFEIVILDMTEQYATLERLKSLTEKAEAANAAKSAFLANMSHEIRTPMNAVLGMDELILRSEINSEVRKYASSIQSAGNTLLSIINDILDISKIEAGKLEINKVEYELSTVVRDVINMTKKKAEDKGLVYSFDIDKELPSKYYGDEIRIRQILLNVINNAVKYTPHGSVNVSLFAEHVNRRFPGGREIVNLVVIVKDTGIGIKEENIDKLFDNFIRLDENKNREIEGTGLGLPLTKQLVELMEGDISVTSVYNEGSQFTLTIPQVVIDDSFIALEKSDKADTDTVARATFAAPTGYILAVDDSDVNLEVIRGLLNDTQLRIDYAMSGKEAVEKTSTNQYDIILLDSMMPDMSGKETMDIIRWQPNNTSVPIVVFTADAVSGAKEAYLNMGFTDFLSKPVVYKNLEKMIMTYLPQEKLIVGEEYVRYKEKMREATNTSRNESTQKTMVVVGDVADLKYHKEALKDHYNGVFVKDEQAAQKYLGKHRADFILRPLNNEADFRGKK